LARINYKLTQALLNSQSNMNRTCGLIP